MKAPQRERYRDAVKREQELPQRVPTLTFKSDEDRIDCVLMMGRDAALTRGDIGQRVGLSVWKIGQILRQSEPQSKRGYAAVPWGWRSQDPKRDAEVRRMRDCGMSLRAIGDQFGLSRERIRQIAKRAGCTFVPQTHKRESAEFYRERDHEIRRRVITDSVALLASEYGISQRVQRICRGVARPRRRAQTPAVRERNAEIRRKAATESLAALAREYGLSRTHVGRICSGMSGARTLARRERDHEIRRKAKTQTYAAIAREYGIHPNSVGRICRCGEDQ